MSCNNLTHTVEVNVYIFHTFYFKLPFCSQLYNFFQKKKTFEKSASEGICFEFERKKNIGFPTFELLASAKNHL